MKGDYSRIPFDDKKKMQHYRKAYLQQGRVLLDSDLNENTDLLQHQTKTLAKDTACLCGSPNSGFRIGKGVPLLPVDSAKGWSLVVDGKEITAEPAVSYESENIFEGKGSLMVKNATGAFFTAQKPIDLGGREWIRIGLKGKGNTVPAKMPLKFFSDICNEIPPVGTPEMENGFLFFKYSLKNIFPAGSKITKIGFSGFENEIEQFSWNDIIVENSIILSEFLKTKYDLEIRSTIISETKIRVDTGKNFLTIELSTEQSRVILKFDDGRIDEFPAKMDGENYYIYHAKTYLIGAVECSPPMFTLDPMTSAWSWEEPTQKVVANVSIESINEECLAIIATGITKLKKELAAPVDFGNYATLEFGIKREGSSNPIVFYVTDTSDMTSAIPIGTLTPEFRQHSISMANLRFFVDIKSIKEYGFENLSPGDTYHFGRILYEMALEKNFVITGSDLSSCETGRLYVNGELYEKELTETYLNQKDYPSPPPIIPPVSGIRKDLVYAEVWQRHVTPLEDPQLRETALGGPDTCNRIKAVAQVKVLPDTESLSEEQKKSTGDGRLSTVRASSLTVKSCEISPEDEYTGQENRLYRIEIHSHGSVDASTFKWSRNNASTVSPIVKNIELGGLSIVVKDSRLFRDGDIIEITDDLTELCDLSSGESGKPRVKPCGELRQITKIDPDENELFWDDAETIKPFEFKGKLRRPYAADGMETTHPKVIKWDGVRITSTESIDLKDGVKIKFSGSDMRTGDYWTFTARASTHEVERLENEPAHGIIRHFCPLAIIHWNDKRAIDRIEDIRGRFKPLGELGAADIAFDCKNSAIQAENVQQAIENLQVRIGDGTNLDLIASSLTLRCNEVEKIRWPRLESTMRKDGSKHGDICFFTGGDLTVEKVRILEEGHVGIGTVPENKEKWEKVLDIWGCHNSQLSVRSTNVDARIQVQEKDDNNKLMWPEAPEGMIVGTKSMSKLSLATNGEARMVIDEYGRVGIGTHVPAFKLHISADNTDAQQMISSYASNLYQQSMLILDKGRGTAASPISVQKGDHIFGIYGRAYNAGEMRVATGIKSIVDGAPGAKYVPGALAFFTSTNLSEQNEVMRIMSSGTVGIGKSYGLSRLTVKGSSSLEVKNVHNEGESDVLKGTGTSFFSQIELGDRIEINGEKKTVIDINGEEKLKVNSPIYGTNYQGSKMKVFHSLFRAEDSGGNVRLLVSDEGNIGIGTPIPENADGWSKVLDILGDTTTKLSIRTSKIDSRILAHESGWYGAPAGMIIGTKNNYSLSFMTKEAPRMTIDVDGKVGIGIIPNYALDVKSSNGIKLGLEGDGGGQLIIGNNKNDNKIFLEALNSTGNGHASELLLTGRFAANVPKISLHADNTYMSGNVGIGKEYGLSRLTVKGSSSSDVKNVSNSQTDELKGTGTSFLSQIELGDIIEIQGEKKTVKTIIDDEKLIVNSPFDNTHFKGSTMKVYHSLLRVEDNYVRLLISSEGKVGIGTINPRGALHVRVTNEYPFVIEGATNEKYLDELPNQSLMFQGCGDNGIIFMCKDSKGTKFQGVITVTEIKEIT